MIFYFFTLQYKLKYCDNKNIMLLDFNCTVILSNLAIVVYLFIMILFQLIIVHFFEQYLSSGETESILDTYEYGTISSDEVIKYF